MKRFLITFLAVIAAQVFLCLLALVATTSIVGVLMMGKAGMAADVPDHAFLIQEIPTELPEYIPTATLPFLRRPLSLTDILENLEKARYDKRIHGVILTLEMPQVGWGKLQEIRARVRDLREAGKPVYAYTTFATNKEIYLAAACDSVFLHPRGFVLLSGFNAERLFVRQLLDHVGIETQISRIKEYKAMAEMFTRDDMSPEARENAAWILEGLYDEFLATLARDRATDESRVRAWLETAQFNASEARAAGIIDGALFWEELETRLDNGWAKDWSIDGHAYAKVPRRDVGLRGEKIAVVHGAGLITQGESGWVFPFGEAMGDETIIAALREATEDEKVGGILLRLDTGGGLTTASDRIGRVVEEAARHKPVVVSMVDMAASGGYMVSYRCEHLVALPGTIVGSIGSINMRGNLAPMLAKLGITVDRVTLGPHPTALSSFANLTTEEFDRLEALHWREYQQWVQGVAAYRGMTDEEIDRLARGRVFTGEQALERGLIDHLGGQTEALAILKTELGLQEDAAVSLLHLPVQKGFLERLAAGEIGAAVRGLRGTEDPSGSWDASARFWRRCLAADESLAFTWWRF